MIRDSVRWWESLMHRNYLWVRKEHIFATISWCTARFTDLGRYLHHRHISSCGQIFQILIFRLVCCAHLIVYIIIIHWIRIITVWPFWPATATRRLTTHPFKKKILASCSYHLHVSCTSYCMVQWLLSSLVNPTLLRLRARAWAQLARARPAIPGIFLLKKTEPLKMNLQKS